MMDRCWRACRWLAIALSIGLASAGVARADVDITGDWDVVLPFGGFFMSVVQQGNVNDWRVGDRVRITGSAGNARVSR